MNSNASRIRGLKAVHANVNPVELIRGIQAGFEAHRDNTKATLQAIQADVDTGKANILALRDRLVEVEQRSGGAPIAGFGGTHQKTLASLLAAAPEFAAMRDRRTKSIGIPVDAAALLAVQANTITNDGDLLAPAHRLNGIVAGPQRRAYLRQILPIIPCSSGQVEFTRELAFTNAAATQAGGSPIAYEGVTKAQSDITFELATLRVPTVAHWVRMSRQAMDDQPALQNFLQMRLTYGLELELERQIIAGDGLGGDMAGLSAAGNHTAFTPTSGETALDSMSRAKAALETAGYSPSAIVMHPNDFGSIERLTTTTGEYLVGEPASATQPSLWGLPVFRSATVPAGKFAMLDASCVALFLRQDAVVDLNESDGDNFVKNLITVRAELRAVLGVLVPAGVLYGDLTL